MKSSLRFVIRISSFVIDSRLRISSFEFAAAGFNMFRPLVETFIKLFVTIDPIGLLPVFLALTSTMSATRRREVTFEGVSFALVIAVVFMILGNAVFKFIGITEADFRIAGGAILLVLAMIDLLIPGKPAVDENASVGLFPLAMPLIAGPATLTTTLVLANSKSYGYGFTSASLALNFALLLAVLLSANWIIKLIGLNALRGLSKLVMVLLAALAVNLIRTGVAQAIIEMRGH
jgi:multiple antibiotic resistance protein